MTTIKISVNKFCEYGRSSKAKRRSDILKAQKEPKTGDGFPQYYSAVRQHVINYLCSQDVKEIKDAKNKLKLRGSNSKWFATDNKISINLLDSVVEVNMSQFDKYRLVPTRELFEYEIDKLKVKINPDILIYDADTIVGAIKTHFGKSNPLSEEVRYDIALMVKLSLQKKYEEININPKLCISLDVPTQKYSGSKSAVKRRLEHLESTALEISALWDVI